MKQQLHRFSLLFVIFLMAFSFEAAAKDKRIIERGMTKQEVIQVLTRQERVGSTSRVSC